MNITESIEEVIVYPDLLYNSENTGNESLNKILNGLKNPAIMEELKSPLVTYSSPSVRVSEHIRRCTHLASYKESSRRPSLSLQVEQEWEGYVQEIDDKNSLFTALLLDITDNKKYPTEEADFRQTDIDEFDHHFLRPGAVFRWIIGYERSISGTKRRVSKLIFRRMPKWNKDTIKQADKKAQQFKDEIIWE